MMAQSNPTSHQPHSLAPTSISPEGEMVAQDEPFQSLTSRDVNVGLQGGEQVGEQHKGDAGREDSSIKGTLISHDVRRDGCCTGGGEGEEGAFGDTIGLAHPTDETAAAPCSVTGSLRSGECPKDNPVEHRCDSESRMEALQKKMEDMNVGEISERVAGDLATRGPAGYEREGQCHSVSGTVSHNLNLLLERRQVEESGSNEGQGIRGDVGERGNGRERGVVGEGEAALFPMQSIDDGLQTFHQGQPSWTLGDSIRSLHSSHSKPSIGTSQYSPPSSTTLSRSQSLQTSRRNEHFDLLLIYSREDEKSCALPFRDYAESKHWKVTSTAELPIGPLSLANFRKAIECCSYTVLLISSHFTSDKVCERHYNIAIQYGDKHPDFTDSVLPIIFEEAELPAELDAIQNVRWGSEYFDTVMTRSIDVQKRLDREMQEAARISSHIASRSVSVDVTRCTSTPIQRVSSPPTLSVVPARMPVHGTPANQTMTATQQPVRMQEQEACLMPSDQSPVLPPIPVAASLDAVATQSHQPRVAATTPGDHQQVAATASGQSRASPVEGSIYDHGTAYGNTLQRQPTTPEISQQQGMHQQHQTATQRRIYHQTTDYGSNVPLQPRMHATGPQQAMHQQHVATMQYHPPHHLEAPVSMPLQHGGSVASPHNTIPVSSLFDQQKHLKQQQHQSHVLPATYQPPATHQQHTTPHQHTTHQQQAYMVPAKHLPSHYPLAAAMQSCAMDRSSDLQSILSPGQHTIVHPTQDYMNMTGEEIFRSLSPERNPGQAASQMLSSARFSSICELLDANDIRGYDWRFLAEILGLSSAQIRILEQNQRGQTRALLEVFFLKNGTEGKVEVLEELRRILREMKRSDAAEVVDKEITIARCKLR